MDINTECDTDMRAGEPERYEPPMLGEIGKFAALTRFEAAGSLLDLFGFWN